MKILHTSDLHVGKKLDGISRIDEQRDVLNEIIDIAIEEKVSLVFIAGDVYDTFIPSSEAENLFFEVLDRFSANGITVVAVSGNHDDEDRLLASKALASKRGIYLCGSENSFDGCSLNKIKVDRSGAGFIVLNDGDEKVFIATVPYFGEVPIGSAVDKEQTFSDRVCSVFREVLSAKCSDEAAILITHLFMLGGSRTDGERDIDLGGVKLVSPSAIPSDFVYTALGHLHKRQVISNDRFAIYSGSPLQYSYDEVGVEKSVTVFEIVNKRVENLRAIELKKGKKLAKISCLGVENAEEILKNYTDFYVDLNVISDRPLLFDEIAELKSKHSNITKIRLELVGGAENATATGRKHLSDKELFVEFYRCKYGAEPDEEVLRAYLEIMSEE